MLSFIKGKIEFKGENFVIIEAGGLGYKVFCSPRTLDELSVGEGVKIFTYLHVRENALELYGFLTKKELELFEILEGISGIGPKTATSLASLGSLEKLKKALEEGRVLEEVRGIGKKKAQRILLELTGKVKELQKKETSMEDEALKALIGLGFSKKIAKQALEKIPKEIEETEQKVKQALKVLGK